MAEGNGVAADAQIAGERLPWPLRGEHTFAYCSRLPKLWYVASMGLSRLALSRRNLIYLAVADVALYVIAQAAFNGDSTGDNVVWAVLGVGLLLLLVLGVVGLVQSRRSRAR
jgi:hypothetical protein